MKSSMDKTEITKAKNSDLKSERDKSQQNTSGSLEGRRRVLKGAGVVAPLLMTVASRPVLGAQCSPSAWVSGNLSDHGHERDTCGGRSPGYWKTNKHNRWAPTGYDAGSKKDDDSHKSDYGTVCNYKNDGTKFHSVFDGSRYGDLSMMQVLWVDSGKDRYQLGSHIIAALLNAASIPDYGMSVDDVREIYRQLEYSGHYTTTTGETMTPEAIVLFIQNTFIDS